MGIKDPDLAFLNTAKGITKLSIALADGFYFGAFKHHTGLIAIAHKIIVARLGITNLFKAVLRCLFFCAHGVSIPLFGETQRARC